MCFTVSMYVYFCITVRDGGAGGASGRAVVRSENPGVLELLWWAYSAPLVEIGELFGHLHRAYT